MAKIASYLSKGGKMNTGFTFSQLPALYRWDITPQSWGAYLLYEMLRQQETTGREAIAIKDYLQILVFW
jgi:hypothetical protein